MTSLKKNDVPELVRYSGKDICSDLYFCREVKSNEQGEYILRSQGYRRPNLGGRGMKLTDQIELGDGAIATIVNPQSFRDGGVMWRLRYANYEEVRYTAASIIESYDYLLSSNISTTKTIHHLRILRTGRAALAQGGVE